MLNGHPGIIGKSFERMLNRYAITIHDQKPTFGAQLSYDRLAVTTSPIGAIDVGAIPVGNEGADSLFKQDRLVSNWIHGRT